ncbi:MAG: SOS response-associated peptidase [Anaerolineae bacterium]|nr:SOS response-associated peptidase [Anaerolineae bacterium]
MCGRFTLWLQFGDLAKAFPDFEFSEELDPRYNIAPTQRVAAVPNDGTHRVGLFHWGLVPFWAKDSSIGSRLINARSETAAEKPAFRAAYRRRRCLILADGFYEWQAGPNSRTKTPMYIRLASGEPFAFAGLWEVWRPDDTPLVSCTILTTEPNSLMAPIHNRMPVILPRTAYDRWLDPAEVRSGALRDLLVPYAAEEMTAYPVSRLVNSPSNDTPALVERVTA